MEFKENKGIAYCGIACVLCSYKGHENCTGCVANIQDREDDCCIRQCAAKRGIDGCYACNDYPCGQNWYMLHDKVNKAFIRYAREFGKLALIERLRINNENGIIYNKSCHIPYSDTPTGDYHALETEDEIYRLLRVWVD